jgi:pimeloyl-ACP methyl ester carboxylesterase
MPRVKAGNIQMNYEQQGTGDPLILIPYLAAEHACYAFQVADYATHFTCISVDPRGTGESDRPEGTYSTELFADDVASLMHTLGIEKAHIYGVSLGGATGMWLAAKYPDKLKSLSLHSTWPKSDPYLKAVVAGWQLIAKQLDDMPEAVIQALFPWCFTPELYAGKPDYIQSLADFVRSRPKQPLDTFLRQSDAVIAHDAEAQLGKIRAPTQITFGRHDQVCSTRFAEPLRRGIAKSEVHVFENCSHAGLYEDVPVFNEMTLGFLRRHSG